MLYLNSQRYDVVCRRRVPDKINWSLWAFLHLAYRHDHRQRESHAHKEEEEWTKTQEETDNEDKVMIAFEATYQKSGGFGERGGSRHTQPGRYGY